MKWKMSDRASFAVLLRSPWWISIVLAAALALGMLSVAATADARVFHARDEALKLAFADVYAYVAERKAMHVRTEDLLDPNYLRQRAALIGLLGVLGITTWQATVGFARDATLGEVANFGLLLFQIVAFVQLLLTLFFRHFPKLIETGHVYVARPPLFRVDVPARGKEPAAKMYALDEGELHAILDKCAKDGVPQDKCQISRFKGLGEMNPEQLWETTLNPDTRRLLPVQLGNMDFAATENLITQLMGKGEAAARRELMEIHGDSIEIDI